MLLKVTDSGPPIVKPYTCFKNLKAVAALN